MSTKVGVSDDSIEQATVEGELDSWSISTYILLQLYHLCFNHLCPIVKFDCWAVFFYVQ